METVIKEWHNSGQSKKEFCRDRKIVYQTFHYWFKRLSNVSSSGFSEVNIPVSRQISSLELIFPSGARMIFSSEPSTSWLRDLVK